MEFGLVMMNYNGCWEDAAFAEQHGFHTVGFTESPLLCGDPAVSMAMTAQRTTNLRIGTLLSVDGMRSAPASASAISAVNMLAPGRVFFGTGTGFTGRQTFGLPPLTASRTRRYLEDVRNLLAGREVSYRDGTNEVWVRQVSTELLENNAVHPVPCYMAADGPKALRAAGQSADGWVATLALAGAEAMTNAPDVFSRSLDAVKQGAAEAGRSVDDLYTTWVTAVCVLEPGESPASPRAIAQLGPYAMFSFHSYACNPAMAPYLPPEIRDRIDIYEKSVLAKFDVPRERLYQEVHAGHLTHLLAGEDEVLTELIMRKAALIGTAEQIAGQLQTMADAGLKNVSVSIPTAHAREVILDIESKLMPLLH
jgi:alkanesulfonate monooxygenase SsuD/methylene tetrahydromethanopterin reductase-like flavin-dependent oxidoreductase (luciferase family)